ncbi:MAG: nucleotide excision repair endonuclease, partial [Sphingobacterium sp.]
MEDGLLKIIAEIPNAVGVYFIYDKLDRLLYVGKSIHIRKRLLQHFKSTDYREVRIRQEIARIDYEILGDETIALLHESDLIKLHQPKYNRALRKNRYSFGLYVQTDPNGYLSLY